MFSTICISTHVVLLLPWQEEQPSSLWILRYCMSHLAIGIYGKVNTGLGDWFPYCALVQWGKRIEQNVSLPLQFAATTFFPNVIRAIDCTHAVMKTLFENNFPLYQQKTSINV